MTGRAWRAAAAAAVILVTAGPAAAQGLVWNLPEDGTEVVYGGTLTQTDIRPGGEEATMSWDRQLVIRSVGTQDVTYRGEMVPGRWLEFELATGRATEQGIDPGPVGRRVYRVLVAEPAVTGKPADERGIPNAFLPIVEGYVQIADRPVQKLDSNAFETYPVLALLMNYKPNELRPEAEGEAVDVPAGQFTATRYAAGATVESPSGKVDNAATFSVSPEMPLGLVRWNATVSRSTKDPNQPRDAYTQVSRIEEQMEARVINRNAR
ncbi:MAG TPA: hypothetical protein VF170_14410, partial [Planctomycetaceae bacterium]